jgi:hypothetical protein
MSLQRQFATHWCFNFIFQMPKWVRMIFGHQVNSIIMLLQKKFQKNPHHHLGFMIKYLEEVATGNEFAAPDNGAANFPVGVVLCQINSMIPKPCKKP